LVVAVLVGHTSRHLLRVDRRRSHRQRRGDLLDVHVGFGDGTPERFGAIAPIDRSIDVAEPSTDRLRLGHRVWSVTGAGGDGGKDYYG
jgi:hypothetical protein